MARRLEGKKEARQLQRSRQGRNSPVPVEEEEWWGEAKPGGGEGPRGEEEDEGAVLARKVLLPFRGVHNSECDACGDGGDLLCCETCSVVVHATCMLRPPSLSEDLFCDRCKEDAYKKAQREPKGVSELALFSSEVRIIPQGHRFSEAFASPNFHHPHTPPSRAKASDAPSALFFSVYENRWRRL
jgi:hypothetical protein